MENNQQNLSTMEKYRQKKAELKNANTQKPIILTVLAIFGAISLIVGIIWFSISVSSYYNEETVFNPFSLVFILSSVFFFSLYAIIDLLNDISIKLNKKDKN